MMSFLCPCFGESHTVFYVTFDVYVKENTYMSRGRPDIRSLIDHLPPPVSTGSILYLQKSSWAVCVCVCALCAHAAPWYAYERDAGCVGGGLRGGHAELCLQPLFQSG